MPTSRECLLLVNETVRELFNDEELNLLIGELERTRNARIAEGLLDIDEAMAAKAEEIVSNLKKEKAAQKQRLLQAIVIGKQLDDLGDEAVERTGKAALAVEASTVGVNTVFFESRSSVDFNAKALFSVYLSGFFSKINEATGLLDEFLSKGSKVELDIANELAHVQAGLGPATKNKKARQIAEILDEVDRNKVATENRAGANIELRGFRVSSILHDRSSISRATFKVWSDFFDPLIDWETMKVDGPDRGKLLQDAYDELTTGGLTDLRAAQESDSIFIFTPGADIAKQASFSRRFVFRTDHKDGPAGAWIEYNRKFGMKSFREAWTADLKRSAENTALMDKFGHRPQEMFDRWVARLAKKYPDQIKDLTSSTLVNQFKSIDGSTNIDNRGTVLGWSKAAIGQETRAIASEVLLGNAGVMALLDVGIGMSFIRMFRGGGFIGPLVQSADNFFKGMTDGRTREISDMLGLGRDVTVGEILTRFSSADNNSGFFSKHLQLFFKLNLLSWVSASGKRGMGAMLGKDLADLPVKWDDIPTQWKNILGTYGIDARGWAVGRAAITDVHGRKVMVPAEIINVRGISALEGLSDRAQLALLDKMRLAYSAFLTDITDSTTLTSGARERAIFVRGLPRGSTFGEVGRFIGQFKGPPIAILTRVIGRQLLGRGSKSLQDAIFRGEGDIIGVAWLIATLTIMGMGVDQLLQLSKLRKPRPASMRLLLDGFIRGGGGGIYVDFLFHESARYGTTATSAIVGPVPSILFDAPMRLRANMMAGKDVGPEFIRFIRSLTPDFFYTQAALDYLIFYQLQEMVNPGYLGRMERGLESTGRKFFSRVRPSRIIPRGGGGLNLGG